MTNKLTKSEQMDEFLDRCNKAFIDIYGEDMTARPDTHYIVHVSDVDEMDKGIDGLGGNGCAVCGTEALNVFIIMNGIKHASEESQGDDNILTQGVVSKNQMN